MFSLYATPVEKETLIRDLVNTDAGAFVIFEGTVRNHNIGRDVMELEYEASEPLAKNEFEKILREAREQFEFLNAKCIHRVGKLKPGDVAVWIGVTSVHRSSAFAVCKYLIDEVKKRLPIWKKEYYANGDSGWINAP